MFKRIVIITDSVGMPRDDVSYEDTWIYLLKKEFPDTDIIDRSARGTTSLRIVTEGGGGKDLLETYHPDCVILQLGITDCAPRLFDKKGFTYSFINTFLNKKLRDSYIRHVKKHRVRNPLYTEISPFMFQAHIESFAQRALNIGASIIAIGILPPSSLFYSKSPHIGSNIDRYNSIYKNMARNNSDFYYLDPVPDGSVIDELCVDELHLNSRGHKIVFSRLKELINSLNHRKIT